jgi:transposase
VVETAAVEATRASVRVRALTTITIVRMRVDPATRAYVVRRRAEGRTTKEIMRSLKRYITRHLFRRLAAAHPTVTAT